MDSIGQTILETVAQKGILSAICVAGFVDGASNCTTCENPTLADVA